MDSGALREAKVTLETLLLESVLEPLAGSNDALASYGMESFARLLAQRLQGQ